LDVAKWLVDTFHLIADDVRANVESIFRMVCYNSQFNVAAWMMTFFDISEEIINATITYLRSHDAIAAAEELTKMTSI
jgi:hypothetical protein